MKKYIPTFSFKMKMTFGDALMKTEKLSFRANMILYLCVKLLMASKFYAVEVAKYIQVILVKDIFLKKK